MEMQETNFIIEQTIPDLSKSKHLHIELLESGVFDGLELYLQTNHSKPSARYIKLILVQTFEC